MEGKGKGLLGRKGEKEEKKTKERIGGDRGGGFRREKKG